MMKKILLTLLLLFSGFTNAAIGPAYGTTTIVGGFVGGLEITGVDVSASPQTVTISSADIAIEEKAFIIKDESGNAGINTITIDTQGSELIDGVSSVTIIVNYGAIKLYSRDGALFSW